MKSKSVLTNFGVKFWQHIYREIEDEKYLISLNRGEHLHKSPAHALDGVFVLNDEFALRYRKLDAVQRHVGSHLFRAEERARGFADARCYYELSGHETPHRQFMRGSA